MKTRTIDKVRAKKALFALIEKAKETIKAIDENVSEDQIALLVYEDIDPLAEEISAAVLGEGIFIEYDYMNLPQEVIMPNKSF